MKKEDKQQQVENGEKHPGEYIVVAPDKFSAGKTPTRHPLPWSTFFTLGNHIGKPREAFAFPGLECVTLGKRRLECVHSPGSPIIYR